MKLVLGLAIIVSLICSNLFADEISVTLKPSKGLTGISSMSFHEDGNVTLLVYESAAKMISNTLELDAAEAGALKGLARDTLGEYLQTDQYEQWPSLTPLLGIAHTRDEVTKSISSRRYSAAAMRLVEAINPHLPLRYRISLTTL